MDNYLDNYQKKRNIKTWQIRYSCDGVRQIRKLPLNAKQAAYTLVRELELYGPYRANWRNYGKLKGIANCFHCHINSGRPRYVVCWRITDKNGKVLEVYYAGTHEKAPY